MLDNNLKEQAATSLIWKLFEKFGTQLISFTLSIVLARLLMPEDYGTIALLSIFVQVASVFVQSGFATALVRKEDADDLDFSSVFYFSLAVSIILYLVLFFTAPLIADFYEIPMLKNVLRVMALTIIVGSYNGMQNVKLQKELMFKKLFYSSFGAVILSGIVGITMAYLGFGVWALAGQQVTAVVVTSVVMTFTVKWRPRLMFSFRRLKSLFKFGWKLLFSGLLDVVYNNIYSLIIGKKYSSADLGYWNKAKQFPSLVVDNVNGSIASVMYPVFSRLQGDKPALKSAVRRSIRISSYMVFPLMMGLAMCAEPVVRLVLGDKWMACVPFLQGWCFCYALMPVHVTNLQVYNALGRSDVFLALEIVKKVIGVSVLFVTLPFGLEWMMFGKMCTSIVSGFINAAPNVKILGYKVSEQLMDFLPSVCLSIVMGGFVFGVSFIPMHYIGVLVVQVLVGVIVYVGLSALFKLESFKYIVSNIKVVISKLKDKINNKKNMNSTVKKNDINNIDIDNSIDNDVSHVEDATDSDENIENAKSDSFLDKE